LLFAVFQVSGKWSAVSEYSIFKMITRYSWLTT